MDAFAKAHHLLESLNCYPGGGPTPGWDSGSWQVRAILSPSRPGGLTVAGLWPGGWHHGSGREHGTWGLV